MTDKDNILTFTYTHQMDKAYNISDVKEWVHTFKMGISTFLK